MNNVETSAKEYEAIAKALQPYIDGARSGKGADMKPAFHETATIFGHAGEDLLAGPIQLLFDWADDNGPAPALQTQIESVDIVGTAATVRLELINLNGYQYTDLLSLLKTDDGWTIVNKVFHFHS